MSEFVTQGLQIKGIPTSLGNEELAKKFDIPLTSFSEVECLDFPVDGADEVDIKWNMEKGGGGALFREKKEGFL